MNKSTPGPWMVEQDTPSSEFLFIGDGARTVAMVPKKDGESLPNARLIATAPELLKALEQVVSLASLVMNCANRDGCKYNIEKELAEARKVIEKAKGTQN